MRTSFIMITTMLLFTGCSSRAIQTEVTTPHEHRPVNTIRPGNAIGNSLVVPEPFQGIGEDRRRASLPSTSAAATSSTDWLAASEPFAPLSEDRSAGSGSGADAEQILGLEPSSLDATPTATSGQGNLPATSVSSDGPSWSDIAPASD